VAPIFNAKGYVGTSLSDLSRATGMTKGALYCNFANKEEIALAAFKFNVYQGFRELNEGLAEVESPLGKLEFISRYYRDYYEKGKSRGGCPVVNVSVDARKNNPRLFAAVQKLSRNLVRNIRHHLQEGQAANEIRMDIDTEFEAKNIYSMIQGGVFMAQTHDDASYLRNIMDQVARHIELLKRN
jgi:AcrR family transcriptional regulator